LFSGEGVYYFDGNGKLPYYKGNFLANFAVFTNHFYSYFKEITTIIRGTDMENITRKKMFIMENGIKAKCKAKENSSKESSKSIKT